MRPSFVIRKDQSNLQKTMESVSNLNGFEEDNDDYIDLPELVGHCDSDSDDDDTDEEYNYNLEEDDSGNKSKCSHDEDDDSDDEVEIQNYLNSKTYSATIKENMHISMHQIDWYI